MYNLRSGPTISDQPSSSAAKPDETRLLCSGASNVRLVLGKTMAHGNGSAVMARHRECTHVAELFQPSIAKNSSSALRLPAIWHIASSSECRRICCCWTAVAGSRSSLPERPSHQQSAAQTNHLDQHQTTPQHVLPPTTTCISPLGRPFIDPGRCLSASFRFRLHSNVVPYHARPLLSSSLLSFTTRACRALPRQPEAKANLTPPRCTPRPTSPYATHWL